MKTLHPNCFPSIYKIMQTKNANESVLYYILMLKF